MLLPHSSDWLPIVISSTARCVFSCFPLTERKSTFIRCRMLTNVQPESALSDQESSCLSVVLGFIGLICHSGAIQCLPLEPTSTLLSDLTLVISNTQCSSEIRISLLDCLVNAYSKCRLSKPPTNSGDQLPVAKLSKLWKDEDAYNVALDMNGMEPDLACSLIEILWNLFSHILLTAALASYVALTIRKSTDHLLVAELWDFLRDALIILASGRLYANRVPNKTESELTNVAEKICKALEVLLGRCDTTLGAISF